MTNGTDKTIISPADLGLPAKFTTWRPGQWQAVLDGVSSTNRFVAQAQRPGAGKSLVVIAQALLTKSRVMILTGLKGLQDQLADEFGELGLAVLKGKSNYTCEANPENSCEEGNIGKCHYRGSTICPWTAAKQAVMESQLSTTNYSCWIAANKYGGGLGDYDLLVLDEAHNAPGYLAHAMRIMITKNELEKLKWKAPEITDEMVEWKDWARVGRVRAQDSVQALKLKIDSSDKPSRSLIRDYRHFHNLSRKLSDIASCTPDKWICDTVQGVGYQFDPIDVSEYAERYLFHNTPKVLFHSGTIKPRTMDMLGVPEDELDFFDYEVGKTVNVEKSPLIHIPTIYVSRNTSQYDLHKLVDRVDEIMEAECEYKGIIHTGNFDIRDFIFTHSQYQKFMHTNWTQQGDVTSVVINNFKEAHAPAALISPSITTGYDFPGDFCRYQIIAKLPYPNLKASKVDQERERRDPNLGIYQMWQSLAQAFGRADRAEDDWQRVYVLDNNIQNAIFRYSDLAPPWLPLYYRKLLEVPMFNRWGD